MYRVSVGEEAARSRELAERVAEEARRTGRFMGVEVDEVEVVEGRGRVYGWSVEIHVVRGTVSYEFWDAREGTIAVVEAGPGSVAVALGLEKRVKMLVVYG